MEKRISYDEKSVGHECGGITNTIRGSAAATEIFKAATEHIKSHIISREEVDRVLKSGLEDGGRKKRGFSWSSGSTKRAKVEQLEARMYNMFSSMMAEIKSFRNHAWIDARRKTARIFILKGAFSIMKLRKTKLRTTQNLK